MIDSVKKNSDMILRLALEGRQVMLWSRVYLDVWVFAPPDSLHVQPITSWCACSHWLPPVSWCSQPLRHRSKRSGSSIFFTQRVLSIPTALDLCRRSVRLCRNRLSRLRSLPSTWRARYFQMRLPGKKSASGISTIMIRSLTSSL